MGDAARRHRRQTPTTSLVGPLERLRRVHALTAAGDACMAVALADSLFLSISPDAARGRVFLFLVVSMAPFMVVAPFIGPVLDRVRGGQRMVVVVVSVLRAAVLVAMAATLESLSLFAVAFAALVLGKTYAISKSALVPTTVDDDEALVAANARLGVTAGIAAAVCAPAAAVIAFVDARAALVVGALAFLSAAANARRLPRVAVADTPAGRLEREELHSSAVTRAAVSMRILRASTGFVFFHLAFWLRSEIAGTAWFGLAVGASSAATLMANVLGPRLREKMENSTMLVTALTLVTVSGFACAWWNEVTAGVVLAATVNAATAIGRLAFEASVQEGAPDANRGRAFARFETLNQLAWVGAGLVPVILAPPGWVGFAMVGSLGAAGLWLRARPGSFSRSRGARATGPARRPRSEWGDGAGR